MTAPQKTKQPAPSILLLAVCFLTSFFLAKYHLLSGVNCWTWSSAVSLQNHLRRAQGAPTAGASRGALVELGPPFSFSVRDNSSRLRKVQIYHAVAVPSEHCVVFLAPFLLVSKPSKPSPDEVFPLPPSFRCAFDSLGGGPAITTRLEIYRTAERYFRSSTVWRCPLPRDSVASHDTVRLLGPENVVAGDGVFSIGGAKVPLKSLVACTNLHSLAPENQLHSKLRQYVAHYRAIGVEHFVFYVPKDSVGVGILLEMPDVTVVHLGASFPERMNGGQSVAATDCVWRLRNRVDWVMNMVDIDEYVAGTRDLRKTLSQRGMGVSAVSLRHRLVQLPFKEPLIRKGLNITTKEMPTVGKAFVRPDHIDVMWVHAATAFSPRSSAKERVLKDVFLLHFQTKHHKSYNTSDTKRWSFETLSSSMLPIS